MIMAEFYIPEKKWFADVFPVPILFIGVEFMKFSTRGSLAILHLQLYRLPNNG
jgi:hypothetical protein